MAKQSNIQVDIQRGVPLPPRRLSSLPWRDMKVGDSFLVPSTIDQAKVRSLASVTGTRLSRKFATRQTAEGLRVWRTK